MKVSVIITVYNQENYIEDTLLSVIDQTYKNIEIIVVDDCSTDNSYNILQKYKNNIKYVKTLQNSGVLLATCEGLKSASGDIIAFLDGDDIWDLEKIENIVKLYQEDSEYVLVSHDYEYINEHGQIMQYADTTQKALQTLSEKNDKESIHNLMRKGIQIPKGYVWLGSAFSINTKKCDLNYFLEWVDTLPKPTMVYQDWPLASYVMVSTQGKFGYINKKLFQYRLHQRNYSGGSKMDTIKAKKVAEKGLYTSLAILELLEQYSNNFNQEEFENMIKHRSLMINEYEFLLALYDRKIFEAYRLFAKLKRSYWSQQEVAKNFLRLVAFSTLGSTFFKAKFLFNKLRA